MRGKEFPQIDFSKFSFPPVELKIVRRNGVLKVFDILRKNYFILTEEELVRQLFVNWMIFELGYPQSLMANEIGIKLNDTFKRCDTVVFKSNGSPFIIVEYKAPKISINQEVFNQIIRYNMSLKADYLIVTNGYALYCCKINYQEKTFDFLGNIPYYQEIKEI